MNKQKKMELLAPAGNLEKLKIAVLYGADAVYVGGNKFGLRAHAGNFTDEEMKEGIDFAHQHGKRVYLTVNIIPHNEDFIGLDEYIKKITEMGIDAVIVSDPGIMMMVKEVSPKMEIHLSTQANATNFASARFWHEQGIKRIVLARELSLKEIKEIGVSNSQELELEVFVHGAMCISYSGRCLLSNYLAGRDSNKGECAHPCRWKYSLVEEKRPGEYLPVEEDQRGTYIFNSKDLCMLPYLKDLQDSGVSCLKIEGRMKSSFYVANVVKAYRQALDELFKQGDNYKFDPTYMEEVSKASHREFTTGFYFGKATSDHQIYDTSSYIREYDFVGIVLEYDAKTGLAKIEQRNRMMIEDEIEIMTIKNGYVKYKISKMFDEKMKEITSAPHAQMTVYMPIEEAVEENAILRRK